jgi:hypothetical protein
MLENSESKYPNMKKNIILFSFCLLASQSFAQEDLVNSEWVVKPRIVDGYITDSRKPYNLYDSNSKIFFRVANDSSNIYLSFKVSDKFEQMKVLKSGMVVILSSKGTKKRKASINYPLADSKDASLPESQPQLTKKKDPKKLHDELKVKKYLLELSGFATENGLIEVDPNSFVYVGIDWDDKETMYYDIIIPFTEFFGDNIANKDLTSPLTLKVVINSMKRPSLESGNRPEGKPADGRGGGMRPGGGMGPGGGSVGIRPEMGNRGGQNNSMFSKQVFEQKFKLAIKQK